MHMQQPRDEGRRDLCCMARSSHDAPSRLSLATSKRPLYTRLAGLRYLHGLSGPQTLVTTDHDLLPRL
jgi:hypothetical protein